MDSTFILIRKMLDSQSELFVGCLYSVLGSVITLIPAALLEDKTPYIKELTQAIIRHCHLANVHVRTKASHFFYLVIKANFAEKKSVSRVRTCGTQSVSQLVANSQTKKVTRKKSI